MTRCVVNVATGRFVKGQERLRACFQNSDVTVLSWEDAWPAGSPPHHEVPYAFKAYALDAARQRGFDLALWLDAAIKPVASLEPIWALIEAEGYWFAPNWWPNGEWCSDAALPLLGITREESYQQLHLVAGAFGLNLRSEVGSGFLDDYLDCAKNGAFKGPWDNNGGKASADPRVRGHRHDQTAASAIAHRRGMKATNSPAWLAYRGYETGETALLVDGSY